MKNSHSGSAIKLLSVLLTALIISGCLHRREVITVRPDGSVDVVWSVAGDEDDALRGLALPTGGPWAVRHWTETQSDGKQKFHYEAKAGFASITDLDKALQFSKSDLKLESSLSTKKSKGKTFYRFERTYRGRDWWKFERLKQKYVDTKLLDKASKVRFEKLADNEKQKLINGLIDFEAHKRALIFTDGLAQSMTQVDFPGDLIARSHAALIEAYGRTLTIARVKQLLLSDKEAQVQQLTEIETGLGRAERTVLGVIFSGYPTERIEPFITASKSDFAFTEDLTDENFEVILNLPGKVITTNGERTGLNSVRWEFKGEGLMNRDVPLVAVSVVD
jgi:hypothetical protein